MQGREWEGGTIFSRNRPLVNLQEIKPQWDKSLWDKVFVRKNSETIFLLEYFERPHWWFVPAPFNANEFMKIIPSNGISKSIFPLACSYHKSSFCINTDVHSINTDEKFFEIASLENCASIPPRGSHVPRVLDAYEIFVVSARLLACEGRRKSLLRNNNPCYWKLALRRSWPLPQAK